MLCLPSSVGLCVLRWTCIIRWCSEFDEMLSKAQLVAYYSGVDLESCCKLTRAVG